MDQFGIPVTSSLCGSICPRDQFHPMQHPATAWMARLPITEMRLHWSIWHRPGVYTFPATAGGLRMLFNGFIYRYPAIPAKA